MLCVDAISVEERERITTEIEEDQIAQLRNLVFTELVKQGFSTREDPRHDKRSKEAMRLLNRSAVQEMRQRYGKTLAKKENTLLDYFADGCEVVPRKIRPKLVLVDSRHRLWPLFNYVKVHWSIPVSSGYGRRLTYIIFDEQNEKVMGIIGLGDPVFNLRARDGYIGWKKGQKVRNLDKMMDGFVIGAVPPYSFILGGKLIASLLFTTDIRVDFSNKYSDTLSYISARKNSGNLVLLTTLSAFGKSSVYDRIKLPNGQRFISVGYSQGWGEFHFNGPLYDQLSALVEKHYGGKTYKNSKWGGGVRNKREVVQKALRLLDLPRDLLKHGISREVFLVPLATNFHDFLIKDATIKYYDWDINEVSDYMTNRWVVPRSERDNRYSTWGRDDYRIYQ